MLQLRAALVTRLARSLAPPDDLQCCSDQRLLPPRATILICDVPRPPAGSSYYQNRKGKNTMTTTMRNPAETSSDRVLAITRIFNAPRHLVFETWTKKKHLDR